MDNRNSRIKTYPLLINGERIDTGIYRYFLDADEMIKNPPMGFQVNRARTDDDIPDEAREHLFARWCLGTNDHNVRAIEAAYAEAGRFDKAVETEQKAIDLLREHGASAAKIQGYEKRLKSYQARKP